MSRRKILLSIGGVYMLGLIVLGLVFGGGGKNEEFKPQDEFELHDWIDLPGPLDFNKGVLYLLLATMLTVGRCSTSPTACRRGPTGCRPRSRCSTR